MCLIGTTSYTEYRYKFTILYTTYLLRKLLNTLYANIIKFTIISHNKIKIKVFEWKIDTVKFCI